jgi:hypothetical protein
MVYTSESSYPLKRRNIPWGFDHADHATVSTRVCTYRAQLPVGIVKALATGSDPLDDGTQCVIQGHSGFAIVRQQEVGQTLGGLRPDPWQFGQFVQQSGNGMNNFGHRCVDPSKL